MSESRIPDLAELSTDGMQMWFAEMSARNLIFHPEESPRDIYNISDGSCVFDVSESEKIERILTTMHCNFGDSVVEAAYPIFMKKAGQMRALDS